MCEKHAPVTRKSFRVDQDDYPVVVQLLDPYNNNDPEDDNTYTVDAYVCRVCGVVYVDDPGTIY